MENLWNACNSLRYGFDDSYDSPPPELEESLEEIPNDSEELEE